MELGQFDLHERIGSGAASDVWLGEHREEGISVAVKFLTSTSTEQGGHRRFHREVRSAAALSHPGIIRIFDFGQVDRDLAEESSLALRPGSPYLVMEFADGGTLGALEFELSWSRLFLLVSGLLRALGHAHSRGVIHRDLKPSNVLLTTDADGKQRFKIGDFGLAFLLDEALRDGTSSEFRTGGTPYFMAPEQFHSRWRDFGPWTDLYGLGCLVWRIVTGEYPFPGETLLEIAENHTASALPDFEPIISLPGDFHRWLARLLEKNPDNRYRFAADALWALLRINESYQGGIDPSDSLGPLSVAKTEAVDPLEMLANPGADTPPAGHPPTGKVSSLGDLESAPRSVSPITRELPPFPDHWSQERPRQTSRPTVGAGIELFNLREFPVVGRHDERDRLWQSLGEVTETRSARMIFLRGPAGVGKTRLARWIRERAEQLGAGIGMKATHSSQKARSDGLVPMIARHLALGGLQPSDAAQRIQNWYEARGVQHDYEWRALTALVLEQAGNRLVDTDQTDEFDEFTWVGSSGEHEPIGGFSGSDEIRSLVRRFLEYAARERPLIVHLDDLHWGLETLHFLKHVTTAGRTDQTRILFVATLRDDELMRRPLEARLVEEFLELDLSELLDIQGLDETHQRHLVENLLRLTPSAAREVVDRAKGNPLYAVELVRDWIGREVLELTDNGFALTKGADAPVPDDIFHVWFDRLDDLLEDESDDVRATLQLGAALGLDVDEEEWRAACRRADRRFPSRIVHRMIRKNLMEATDTGWRFAHAMLRETLERRAREAGRWQTFNRYCAAVVEDDSNGEGRAAERIARYLLEAEEKAAALEPLLDAVEYWGRRGEYDVAGDRLESAQEIADETGLDDRDELAVEMRLREARFAFARNRDFDGAIELLDEVLTSAVDEDLRNLEVEARLALSNIHAKNNQLERAREIAREALDRVDRKHPVRLGRVRFELGNGAFLMGDLEAAATHFRHAVSLFRDVAPVELAKTLIRWGASDKHERNFSDARKKLDRALEIAYRHGSLYNFALAANLLGDHARLQGDFSEASEMYDQACDAAEMLGNPGLYHVFLGPIQLALERSDYVRAIRICTNLERRSLDPPTPNEKFFLNVFWAEAAAGTGDTALLSDKIEELEKMSESFQWSMPDLATALESTAEMVKESGDQALASRAAKLAAKQWNRLGEDQRARSIQKQFLNE